MKKLIALVLAAGAFVLASCTTQQVAKWEYKQLSNGMVTDETLNRLDDEGWNVVGYSSTPGGANGFYILKRRKQ
jgi:hypothetical protein